MSKTRQLITTLMLLIFVGQVTAASVIPCNMATQHQSGSSEMSHSMSEMMAGMDHSAHNMSDAATTGSDTSDCCDANASCSMSSCLSLLTVTLHELNQAQISSQKQFYAASRFISQTPGSLYRPPILS